MAYAPFDLSGKKVLITGGNSGIGLGMAEAVAEAGADVVVWGTNPDKIAAAEASLKSRGVQALGLKVDVASEEDTAGKFAETLEFLGHVDACFANAGVSSNRRATRDGFAGMTFQEWRRVLDVNLDGVFFTLRAAAKHMVERGQGGSLAVTSSLAAIMGQARGEHYGATKGAVIAMSRALAVEYGKQGIRSNAILPGWIESPMTEKTLSWDRFQEAVLPRVPAGRWGVKEDFGGIAVYLVSDASRYHSGDTFVIDGAYSLF
ncbi:MAG: SDR family NAD(P)-dependent oxidoreductase [Alphaproteobacteria bacterium]